LPREIWYRTGIGQGSSISDRATFGGKADIVYQQADLHRVSDSGRDWEERRHIWLSLIASEADEGSSRIALILSAISTT